MYWYCDSSGRLRPIARAAWALRRPFRSTLLIPKIKNKTPPKIGSVTIVISHATIDEGCFRRLSISDGTSANCTRYPTTVNVPAQNESIVKRPASKNTGRTAASNRPPGETHSHRRIMH